MKKTDRISYRQKAPTELSKLLADSQKRLVEARAKQSTGNLKDTSVFKKIKYEINYILTLLTQNGK